MSEPTQEQLDEIAKAIIEGTKHQRERLQSDYDGIDGMPPKWIPNHYRNDFIRYRGRLLDARGYSHADLKVWLDRYCIHFLIELADEHVKEFYRQPGHADPNGFWWPRKYPNGFPVDRYAFMDEIGFLAWLRWCVFDIDKATAKKQLEAGHNIAEYSQQGLKKRYSKFRETEQHCIEVAKILWSTNLEGTPEDATGMAGLLFNDLDNSYNSHLKKPKKKQSITDWLKAAIKSGELIPPE